jgi:hypothetical protein
MSEDEGLLHTCCTAMEGPALRRASSEPSLVTESESAATSPVSTVRRETPTEPKRSSGQPAAAATASAPPELNHHPSMSKIVLSVAMEDDNMKDAVCYGYVLVALILFGFWIPMMYAAFISKIITLQLPTGHPVIDAIAEDEYYSFLVPLTIPVALVVVYLNWFGLKLFRHS